MNYNIAPTTETRLDEEHEQLFKAGHLYENRFSSTDNYTPPDASKNPAALYSYENGYDDMFPAAILSSSVAGPSHENGPVVATSQEAEALIPELEKYERYEDYVDSVRSNLALHHLYDGNLEDANRILHKIEDLGFATHVLAQIVKADGEVIKMNDRQHQKVVRKLAKRAKALFEAHDAHLAPYLEEAAEALGNQSFLQEAHDAATPHFAKSDEVIQSKPKASHHEVDSEGTEKVDMAAFLD